MQDYLVGLASEFGVSSIGHPSDVWRKDNPTSNPTPGYYATKHEICPTCGMNIVYWVKAKEGMTLVYVKGTLPENACFGVWCCWPIPPGEKNETESTAP